VQGRVGGQSSISQAGMILNDVVSKLGGWIAYGVSTPLEDSKERMMIWILAQDDEPETDQKRSHRDRITKADADPLLSQ
jgi:hypothetical protein